MWTPRRRENSLNSLNARTTTGQGSYDGADQLLGEAETEEQDRLRIAKAGGARLQGR
jgi:hypothetical protein